MRPLGPAETQEWKAAFSYLLLLAFVTEIQEQAIVSAYFVASQ